jgi:hypothetical protein
MIVPILDFHMLGKGGSTTNKEAFVAFGRVNIKMSSCKICSSNVKTYFQRTGSESSTFRIDVDGSHTLTFCHQP